MHFRFLPHTQIQTGKQEETKKKKRERGKKKTSFRVNADGGTQEKKELNEQKAPL